jgi:hypothetical protein
MYELALATFGFLLGLLPSWFQRKRRLKTHWCAVRADIKQCNERAQTLLKDDVQSPLYRLPLIAYQTSYPILLADGAVSEDEVLKLGQFFGLVQDINRGLDNAAQIYMSGDLIANKLKSEFNRNRMKAEHLVVPKEAVSLANQALAIVDCKISQRWWRYARNA